MTALYPQIVPCPHPGEGVFERAERRLGRADWTITDYLEAGKAFADRVACRPISEAERTQIAQCFMRINCPPSKLAAAIAERKAEFPA